MEKSPNIVRIKFHGNLGKRLKKDTWNLAVESVSEAFYAVDTMSKRNLVKCLIEDSEKQLQYQVKVDNKLIDTSEIDPEKLSTIENSELCIKRKIKTIDVIPLLEGSGGGGGALMAIVGILLIIATGPLGAIAAGKTLTAMQTFGLMAGMALVTGGISMMLAKPPKFDDFREIEQTKKSTSYLFGGPVNTANEGGPVPVGYGRLIAGSQVIQSSLNTRELTVQELGSYRPS
jgi:predicted phage tail protein